MIPLGIASVIAVLLASSVTCCVSVCAQAGVRVRFLVGAGVAGVIAGVVAGVWDCHLITRGYSNLTVLPVSRLLGAPVQARTCLPLSLPWP